MARTLVICAALLLCFCTFVHCSPVKSGTEELSDRLVSLRHLLETELTVANDNNTYPNTTINVGLSRPEGCIPWWTKTIRPTDLVCPKDCALSGFKEGYNLGQLAPLNIKVERGQVSRVAPRPLKGAFLNITGTSRIDNKADYKYQLSNYGVDYVQFAANYPVGARFTVYLGLVKKDPNAGGSPVADPQAKHSPFCFFNVTWTVVAPGSIPRPPAAAPTDAAEATTATPTKKPAAAVAPVAATDAAAAEATPPTLATSAKKPAAAAQAPAAAAAAAAAKKPAAPAPAPDAQDLSDLGL